MTQNISRSQNFLLFFSSAEKQQQQQQQQQHRLDCRLCLLAPSSVISRLSRATSKVRQHFWATNKLLQQQQQHQHGADELFRKYLLFLAALASNYVHPMSLPRAKTDGHKDRLAQPISLATLN